MIRETFRARWIVRAAFVCIAAIEPHDLRAEGRRDTTVTRAVQPPLSRWRLDDSEDRRELRRDSCRGGSPPPCRRPPPRRDAPRSGTPCAPRRRGPALR